MDTLLSHLLPVIRVSRPHGATPLDLWELVLGLYTDRLTVFRKRPWAAIPTRAYEPDGATTLNAMRGSRGLATVALGDVAEAQLGPSRTYGHWWLGTWVRGHGLLIHTVDERRWSFVIPDEEVGDLALALGRLLQTRFVTANSDVGLLTSPSSPALRRLALWALATLFTGLLLIGGILPTWLIIVLALYVGLSSFGLLLSSLVLAGAGLTELELHWRVQRRSRPRPGFPQSYGARSIWRSKIEGRAVKLLGLLVLWSGLMARSIVALAGTPQDIALLFDILALLPGASLIHLGYRLALRSGAELLAEDNRAPILYLRPFEDDRETNLNPRSILAYLLGLRPIGVLLFLGPIANLHPLRLARLLFSRSSDSSEEQLAQLFRRYGPFVTVGRPGERIALGGAARLYLENRTWQENVLSLLHAARVVVLQPGVSEGIWWEVEHIVRSVPPQRVVLSLLGFHGSQVQYESFRWRFEQLNQRPLPRCLGDSVFLTFDSDWNARQLPIRRRPVCLWPISGCAVDLRATLHSVLDPSTRSQPTGTPQRSLLHIVDAVTAVVVWTVLVVFTWVAAQDVAGAQIAALAPGLVTRATARRVARTGEAARPSVHVGVVYPYRLRLNAAWTMRPAQTTGVDLFTIDDVVSLAVSYRPSSPRDAGSVGDSALVAEAAARSLRADELEWQSKRVTVLGRTATEIRFDTVPAGALQHWIRAVPVNGGHLLLYAIAPLGHGGDLDAVVAAALDGLVAFDSAGPAP